VVLSLFLLPAITMAKPTDLPLGLKAVCEAAAQDPAGEPVPEEHQDLLFKPDAYRLLLIPIDQPRCLTLDWRLGNAGQRFFRMELNWGGGAAALPAVRPPENRPVPLPPASPGW
jgi:hypothetical protein